jgi:hypothetical protein
MSMAAAVATRPAAIAGTVRRRFSIAAITVCAIHDVRMTPGRNNAWQPSP